MERTFRRFTSHEEAARADRELYRSMTVEERFEILRVLRRRLHGPDCPDIREYHRKSK